MALWTWNMEHGSDRWSYLTQFEDPDAICLQETSAYPFSTKFGHGKAPLKQSAINGVPTVQGAYRIGTKTRGTEMELLTAAFGFTGQNSVAVMVKGKALAADVIAPPAPGTRATPGLQHSNGVWVFSIHAPSTQGGAWQMNWIGRTLAAIAGRCKDWICAGDFNAAPTAVAMVAPRGLLVVAPGTPTQMSGNELDFAVCTGGVVAQAMVSELFQADHLPVKLF
jgi:Endonuclease/Exonuclease/phosphatase family